MAGMAGFITFYTTDSILEQQHTVSRSSHSNTANNRELMHVKCKERERGVGQCDDDPKPGYYSV